MRAVGDPSRRRRLARAGEDAVDLILVQCDRDDVWLGMCSVAREACGEVAQRLIDPIDVGGLFGAPQVAFDRAATGVGYAGAGGSSALLGSP